jgi:hypothetical protein
MHMLKQQVFQTLEKVTLRGRVTLLEKVMGLAMDCRTEINNTTGQK